MARSRSKLVLSAPKARWTPSRSIDGVTFKLHGGDRTHLQAESEAKKLRKAGKHARVIDYAPGAGLRSAVYYHRPAKKPAAKKTTAKPAAKRSAKKTTPKPKTSAVKVKGYTRKKTVKAHTRARVSPPKRTTSGRFKKSR